jgi:phage shock protein PspC (stress-responsive transcriptional regulator)
MVCPTCSFEVQPGARFCSGCGQRIAAPYVPVHEAAAQAGLVRPLQGRFIAGVCEGFARRYGWDPVIVRLVLVVAVIFGAGTPILAYIIAWIVMPNEVWMMPSQPIVTPPPPQPGATVAAPESGAAGTMGV